MDLISAFDFIFINIEFGDFVAGVRGPPKILRNLLVKLCL